MKRICFFLFLFLTVAAVRADGPDDQYIQIYNLIQQADTLNQNGQGRAAAQKYQEAKNSLTKLQTVDPTWNEKVVKFRINYVTEKLVPLAPFIQSTNTPPSKAELSTNKMDVTEIQAQLGSSVDEIRRLQTEKSKLEAKLKEALAVRPAAVEPEQLTKAEEKIAALQKERDLLKVTLEQQKDKPDEPGKIKALEKERGVLQEKLNAATQQAAALSARHEKEIKSIRAETKTDKGLERERDELKKKLAAATKELTSVEARHQESLKGSESKKVKQLKQERDELQSKLDEATKKMAAFKSDNAPTESQSKKIQRLEKERDELLKKSEEAARQLAVVESLNQGVSKQAESTKIKQLKEERDELQRKLNEATKNIATNSRRADGETESKIKQLEKDREDLQKQLAAANKLMAAREASDRAEIKKLKQAEEDLLKKIKASNKAPAERKTFFGRSSSSKLQNQLAQAQARLEAYEAKAVPFTPEELALFKKPEPQVAAESKPTQKSSHKLPAGAGALAADAERDFIARRYEDAEKKYSQVLSQDEKNVYVLANLAATQIELNHAEDAEKNVKQALVIDPNDAFTLLLLGKLRFNQSKYDEAIDALSHSVKLNPQSAEAQNYLGIALSEKGQRGPAEAALRKAIQLQPDNAGAHHNLSIVYAAQKPPSVELARWHYQKALNLGHPPNADLEKLLGEIK